MTDILRLSLSYVIKVPMTQNLIASCEQTSETVIQVPFYFCTTVLKVDEIFQFEFFVVQTATLLVSKTRNSN